MIVAVVQNLKSDSFRDNETNLWPLGIDPNLEINYQTFNNLNLQGCSRV